MPRARPPRSSSTRTSRIDPRMSDRLSSDALASLMAANAVSPDEQRRQTGFRVALVDAWQIPEGARVLEIGCGQGDTTAALADALGARGRVIAIDVAEPTYGAPITIGDSARHLSEGPLGPRVKFRYGFDVLDPENAFPDDAFDAIVLAHCTWYFDSLDQLRETLRQIRPWAPRLYLSEWDLEPRALDQTAHLLAVLIQGQIEALQVREPRERADALLARGAARHARRDGLGGRVGDAGRRLCARRRRLGDRRLPRASRCPKRPGSTCPRGCGPCSRARATCCAASLPVTGTGHCRPTPSPQRELRDRRPHVNRAGAARRRHRQRDSRGDGERLRQGRSELSPAYTSICPGSTRKWPWLS